MVVAYESGCIGWLLLDAVLAGLSAWEAEGRVRLSSCIQATAIDLGRRRGKGKDMSSWLFKSLTALVLKLNSHSSSQRQLLAF